MKKEKIKELEKIIGQLEGLHNEIGALARKSPNDALNKFKLKFVNITLLAANAAMGSNYRPFKDFVSFEDDDLPSNSDVTMIISQYLEELERLRSDNIKHDHRGWFYDVIENVERIPTGPPKKIKEKRS